MKVELRPHIGTLPSGAKCEFKQWLVYADGEHVAILDHACEYPLMPVARLIGQPYAVVKEICDKCSTMTKTPVGMPHDVYIPPQLEEMEDES